MELQINIPNMQGLKICLDYTAPTKLQKIFKGMMYNQDKNIIYNNCCEMRVIGYVKQGKIYYIWKQ